MRSAASACSPRLQRAPSLDSKLDSGTLLPPSLARSAGALGCSLIPAVQVVLSPVVQVALFCRWCIDFRTWSWLGVEEGLVDKTKQTKQTNKPNEDSLSEQNLVGAETVAWVAMVLLRCDFDDAQLPTRLAVSSVVLLPWATVSNVIFLSIENRSPDFETKVTIKERHWSLAKSRLMLLLEIQGPGRFPGERLQWIRQLCQVGAHTECHTVNVFIVYQCSMKFRCCPAKFKMAPNLVKLRNYSIDLAFVCLKKYVRQVQLSFICPPSFLGKTSWNLQETRHRLLGWQFRTNWSWGSTCCFVAFPKRPARCAYFFGPLTLGRSYLLITNDTHTADGSDIRWENQLRLVGSWQPIIYDGF